MQKKIIDMKYIAIIFLFFTSTVLLAQKENGAIDEGNKKYTEQDYTGAQKSYNEALQVNPESDAAKRLSGGFGSIQKSGGEYY